MNVTPFCSAAAFMVASMPWPVCIYQPSFSGTSPTIFFQIPFSLLSVPDLSPREKNLMFSFLISSKLSFMSLPLNLSAIDLSAMTTKSLYITAFLSTPKPFSTNSFSTFGECTKSMSASQFSPSFSAAPVPTAVHLISTPVFALYAG